MTTIPGPVAMLDMATVAAHIDGMALEADARAYLDTIEPTPENLAAINAYAATIERELTEPLEPPVSEHVAMAERVRAERANGGNASLATLGSALVSHLAIHRSRRGMYLEVTADRVRVMVDSPRVLITAIGDVISGSDPSPLVDLTAGLVYPVALTRKRADRQDKARAESGAALALALVEEKTLAKGGVSAWRTKAERALAALDRAAVAERPVKVAAGTVAEYMAELDGHATSRVRTVNRKSVIGVSRRLVQLGAPGASTANMERWARYGLAPSTVEEIESWVNGAPTSGASRKRVADAKARLDAGKPWEPRGYAVQGTDVAAARMANRNRRAGSR